MKKINRKNLGFLIMSLLAFMLVLAACSDQTPEVAPETAESTDETAVTEDTTTTEQPASSSDEVAISQPIYRWGEVADQVWVLVGYGDALNPTVVEEGIVITAVFNSTDNQMSGSGGCNNYFTSYESTDDGGLTINGPIGSTMMACEGSMEAESTYFAALETVNGWALNENGNLELTYSSGQPYAEKLVYIPGTTPLDGPIWQLVSYGDPDDLTMIEEGTAVTAEFAANSETTGTVAGNATCNNYSTSYTLDGENISVGPVAGTMMLCPIGADQEAAYLAALSSAQTYQISGPNMQITYDGGVLNYTSLSLPLENVLWQAVMVNGQPIPAEIVMTALFTPGETADAGTLGGNAGCNNYSTSYTTSSDISTNPPVHSLTVDSPMAMTMMLCPGDELVQLEQAYLANIESATVYEILGDQLIVRGESGDILFTADREPLLGTLWTLVSWGSITDPQPPIEGENFTATFSRLPDLPTGTVVGNTDCNEYNATFTADLTNIKINLPSLTNNADCPFNAGNFEAEQQFFLGLNAATSYRIIGNILQLPYGEGESMQALNFEATQPEIGEETVDLTPLAGTFWYLSAFGDNPVLPGTEITAGFNINEDGITGDVSGSGGCNAYNASIGPNFSVAPIASTKKACQQAVGQQESSYFTWLQSAYGFDRAGNQLLISTANGILTFNSTPILDQANELQNITWYLISYEALNAIPGSNPTAFFASDGSSINGKTGCNDYNGAYKAEQGNKLTISNLNSTRAACTSDALQKQEDTFLQLLPAAVSYSVNGSQLQILTVDGGTMNYSSIPPQAPTGPTAVIISEDLAVTGQALMFDGSQSQAGSTPISSYAWDMGDGARLSGQTIQYSYNQAGTFTVKLTVTDRSGLTNTTEKAIQITPVVEVTPPTAVIEGPTMANVGDSVTFSASASQQGTAAITGYQWQSGDGNNSSSIPDNTFSTIYSLPGVYYPSVTVTDANGLSDSASMSISINASLAGTTWLLNNVLPGTSISLEFGNGSIAGFAGCNNYNASYTTTLASGNTNNISIGPITNTSQMCPEDVMIQEQGYLSSLQSASSYTINGTTLTLATASGSLTFSAPVATPYTAPAATQ